MRSLQGKQYTQGKARFQKGKHMGCYKAIVAKSTVEMYEMRPRQDFLQFGVPNSQHPITFNGQELL